MALTDKQRLDRIEATAERLERAVAEITLMVKGAWQGPESSAAAQILGEQRQRAAARAEHEDRVRQEAQAKADAEVERRLAETSA